MSPSSWEIATSRSSLKKLAPQLLWDCSGTCKAFCLRGRCESLPGSIVFQPDSSSELLENSQGSHLLPHATTLVILSLKWTKHLFQPQGLCTYFVPSWMTQTWHCHLNSTLKLIPPVTYRLYVIAMLITSWILFIFLLFSPSYGLGPGNVEHGLYL